MALLTKAPAPKRAKPDPESAVLGDDHAGSTRAGGVESAPAILPLDAELWATKHEPRCAAFPRRCLISIPKRACAPLPTPLHDPDTDTYLPPTPSTQDRGRHRRRKEETGRPPRVAPRVRSPWGPPRRPRGWPVRMRQNRRGAPGRRRSRPRRPRVATPGPHPLGRVQARQRPGRLVQLQGGRFRSVRSARVAIRTPRPRPRRG